MELQEQVTALEGEKKHLISMVENLNCEKIALDQMIVNSIKEIFSLKKDVLIKDNAIQNLNQQIQTLLQEKVSLQNIQSDAQSFC